MGELTIALSTLKDLLEPVLSALVRAALTRNPRHDVENLHFKMKESLIKKLVVEAKEVLDEGKGLDLKRLKNLADKLTEGEIYGDTIKYKFKHKFEGNMNPGDITNHLVQLEPTLKDLISKLSGQSSKKKKDKQPESLSSSHEREGKMPPGNVRRCLLYLSRFPKGYVFNLKRISRLSVAHEFIAPDSSEPLLQVAESSWDGDGAPHHFLIGNNVGKQHLTWPENHYLVREAFADSIESIADKIFLSSLTLLREGNHTLDLKDMQLFLLKVLSLRNARLENVPYLKTLSFLKYLDLKYTNVRYCSWLEGLEELQMLDLRYTGVEEIPDNCLEKLGKLQHLLLGYNPNRGDNGLAGAKLNTKKLMTTNLKTLRAIRRPKVIENNGSVSKVADLSVTGLETEQLKRFWDAVENFENLTSLGVAMTKDSVITLQDCPAKLKDKLKRLRMEGQFPICSTSTQLHSGLAKLCEFKSLIDLTLASHKPLNINSVPPLPPALLCLRLYGFCTETTLTFGLKGF